jgi:hypothetical protein
VDRRLHLILVIAALDLFLYPANTQHRTVHVEERLGRVRMVDALEPRCALTFIWIPNTHLF